MFFRKALVVILLCLSSAALAQYPNEDKKTLPNQDMYKNRTFEHSKVQKETSGHIYPVISLSYPGESPHPEWLPVGHPIEVKVTVHNGCAEPCKSYIVTLSSQAYGVEAWKPIGQFSGHLHSKGQKVHVAEFVPQYPAGYYSIRAKLQLLDRPDSLAANQYDYEERFKYTPPIVKK